MVVLNQYSGDAFNLTINNNLIFLEKLHSHVQHSINSTRALHFYINSFFHFKNNYLPSRLKTFLKAFFSARTRQRF